MGNGVDVAASLSAEASTLARCADGSSASERAPVRSLFRKEAVQAHVERPFGEVILVQPLALKASSVSLSFMLGISVVFLAWADFPRSETVPGYLAPVDGLAKLFPARSGTVSRLDVSQGDAVEENQILMLVRTQQDLADGGLYSRRLLEEISSQRDDLRVQAQTQRSLHRSESARIASRMAALAAELDAIVHIRSLQVERRSIARTNADRVKILAELGVASDRDFANVRDSLLSQEQELAQLDRTRAEHRRELDELRSERRQSDLTHRNRMADFRIRLSELRVRMTEIHAGADIVIKAPISGVVASLEASVGASVSPSKPVAAIVPRNSALEAQLLVPSRAVGFIEPGQEVRLKYDAFPYQRFGLQAGRIESLADTPSIPGEGNLPVSLSEPAYRATVSVERQSILAYGRPYSLQSGMLLEADITLEKRSLLRWILDPIFALRRDE